MIEKSYQNCFFLKLSSFLPFLFADSKWLQKQTRDDVLKTAVNKAFTKLKGKNLIRIKSCNPSLLHRIFGCFPKRFAPAVFKGKYRREVIKTLNIEAPALKVFCEIIVSARFWKIRGKTSIVEFDFSKVAGKKSGAVINMELFLNVYLRILQKYLELFKKITPKRSYFWS